MNISRFLFVLVGLLTMQVSIADETLSSRSAGKIKSDTSIDLTHELKQLQAVVREKSAVAENYDSLPAVEGRAGIANRHDQLFEIYEADVVTLGDLDGDYYHHALNVYFDVDVSIDSATVYAKLYLSREGEPWTQYFTTDLFVIHGDEYADAYEVETELLEGYAPGYYSVLIEIYSLDHADMVASELLDYHYLGRDVLLEDLSRDQPYVSDHDEYSHSTGAGDFTALLFFFLIVQVVIAARGTLTLLPPCKKRR